MATYTNQAPTKDACFSLFDTDANYGNGTKVWLNLASAAPNRMIIEFDLSALVGLYSTLVSATLGLYCNAVLDAGTSGLGVSAYRVKYADWDEGTGGDFPGATDDVSWLRYKDSTSWQTAGGTGANDIDSTYVLATTIPAADAWMEFTGANLLSLIEDAIANRSNKLRLLIKGTSESESSNKRAEFRCREWTTVAQRPKLVIVYTGSPSVDTIDPPTNITSAGATLEGDVVGNPGETIDRLGFVWKDGSAGADPGDSDPEGGAGDYPNGWKSDAGDYGENPFDHAITGLSGLTQYRYRACAHNSSGWAYGDEVAFTTAATHRISNTATVGVKKGGVKLQGARIYIVDMVTETVAKELTDEDGLYEHDEYGSDDLVPKFCAFCVWSDLATLTTALVGSNNDLKFTAKETDASHWYPGTFGHNLGLEYRNPNMNSSALAVLARATLGDLCTNGCFVTDYSGWIAVNTTIERSAAQKKIGPFSLKVVTTANSGYTYFPVTAYSSYASKTLTGGLWVYIPTASHGTWTVKMTDGVGSTSSATIAERDAWVFVKVTRTIDTVPTHLRLHLDCTSGDTGDIAYVSGVDWQVAADITGYTWHDIIVKLATSAGGVITTLASEIKTAIEAQTDANKMVAVENAAGNDGTGTVTAMARANLSGGAYYSDVAHTFITPAEVT